MVLRSKELWDIVEKTVIDHGLELFDIEIPAAEAGVVRVYISRPGSDKGSHGERAGVKVEDCARISRTLLDDERFDEVFPEACILEVSSPGINRKLTKPQHFHGAVGERVKLTVTMPAQEGAPKKGKATVRGVLQAFDGNELKVEDESLKETVSIPWPNVHEARVDFLFK
jgi:ribosome maturation factor RimP